MISGADENGAPVFSHEYAYVGKLSLGGMMEGLLYETADADAGEFKYFFMMPDTPATTYHLEFRYGSNTDDLEKYSEGPYAYWLAAINENLAGHYMLTADIDLAGINWTPIGTYMPSGESEEEQEIPAAAAAFTGTFDGQGHTIRNLTIDQPEGLALGLFGTIANTTVGGFTLENASVNGTVMVSDVVGYAYCSTVSNVNLVNGKVTVNYSEMSAEGMYGGIVGAGMGSRIEGCNAQADIVIPDGTANAGIVGGGLEMTSVTGCTATGAITAGSNCYGLGGISGCGFGSEEFTDNTAENVAITAGDNCFWIGGITGYAGGFENPDFGVPVTAFTNCHTKSVTISAGENAEGIGEIVGAGFYNELAASMRGEPFDKPTVFVLTDCTAE